MCFDYAALALYRFNWGGEIRALVPSWERDVADLKISGCHAVDSVWTSELPRPEEDEVKERNQKEKDVKANEANEANEEKAPQKKATEKGKVVEGHISEDEGTPALQQLGFDRICVGKSTAAFGGHER